MTHGVAAATMSIDLRVAVTEQITAVREAAGTLLTLGVTECTILAFGNPLELVVGRLISGLTRANVEVPHAVRVVGDRCHSYLPDHDEPPGGTPLPSACTAARALLVGIGLATEPEAANVTASLRSPEQLARDAMRAATTAAEELLDGAYRVAPRQARADHRRATFRFLRHAIDQYDQPRQHLTNIEAALLSIQLQDPRIREEAISLIRHYSSPAAHIALWTDLAPRATGPYRPRLLTLLAFAAWQHGDTVRAAIAIERAHRATPDDALTNEVAHNLATGVNPDKIRIDTPAELARRDHAAGETTPGDATVRGPWRGADHLSGAVLVGGRQPARQHARNHRKDPAHERRPHPTPGNPTLQGPAPSAIPRRAAAREPDRRGRGGMPSRRSPGRDDQRGSTDIQPAAG